MDHRKLHSTTLLILTTLLIGAHGLKQRTASATTAAATTTSNSKPAQVSVQTTSGLLRGVTQPLANIRNSSVHKFLAVPYAEAPVDQLRFMRPVEVRAERAQNMVDATRHGKTCPQFRHLTRFISPLLNIDTDHQISEDCLHLNVYVPSTIGPVDRSANSLLEPSKQLPVIVWIPGEGFDFADARQFDGSYLAHKTQSIVITVQYRVGIFGFLQAPKHGISGNMGLYDQLMALKWIKKNADAFGGDSNRISVMGRFSGSMSISTLITAPKRELVRSDDGRALINRAIMLSGIAVNDWIIESQQSKKVADIEQDAVAKGLCTEGQANNGTCLKGLPAEQLLSVAGYGWRLVVDNELIGAKSPADAIRENKLDSDLEAVVLGETAQEGTLCLYRHLLMSSVNNYASLIEEDRLTTDDVATIIQDDSYTYFKYNSSEVNPIQTAMRSFMVDEDSDMDNNEQQGGLRERYLDACSDYMVKSHSKRFRRNLLARNDLEENRMDAIKRPVQVFHYELKYKPTFSLAPGYIKTAAHGDDVPLIFGLVYSQPEKTINEADLLMTRKMMSYIGNFVHGNSPLLDQHQTIETAAKNRNNDNDQLVNMDEHDDSQDGDQAQQMTPKRGSWSSESEVYPMDFSEADYNEISHHMTKARARTGNTRDEEPADASQKAQPQKDVKLNIQLVVVGSPAAISKSSSQSSSTFDGKVTGRWIEEPSSMDQARQSGRARYLLELSARQQQQQQLHQRQDLQATGEFGGNGWLAENNLNSNKNHFAYLKAAPALTKSQQLMAAQQQPTTSLINESSFVTILLFSACIVIFALISFCMVLSLIVFRCNVSGANKAPAMRQAQQFDSSSTCNICGESQGDSFGDEAARKHASRSLCNVFSRLRHHNHHNSSINNNSNSTTTTTTTTTAAATPRKQQLDPTQTSNNRGLNGGLSDGVNHRHHT